MHPNGVSHLTVESDVEGVAEIMRWLSFVPRVKGAPPALLPCSDPIDGPWSSCPQSALRPAAHAGWCHY